MQEKSTTVAAYAAGASLAAIALFYVFGPNYTIDGDESSDHNRKKSIVGLTNPANDCFINSVLQALAGLVDLRLYLIRELHRRDLDGPEVYSLLPSLEEIPRGERPERILELQQGTITRALKEMLDRLNERPIYKKTISARGFIQALEYAYRTRISRSQQDAQEFLQIVAERLCDEYHAGVRARQRWRGLTVDAPAGSGALEQTHTETQDADGQASNSSEAAEEVQVRVDDGSESGVPATISTKSEEIDSEHGFPFEGKLESQIECQFCHYQYKPNQTSFVNLTLQVPQKSSTTLSSCFDGLLKTEYIDDFRCDKCSLQYALEVKMQEKAKSRSQTNRERLEAEIERIQTALQTDPEQSLEGITLPPVEQAPKRRIARHMRITTFPKIIAIHLSRSIFDQSSSTKNAAKVSFPERLALGGILSRKWFTLLAIVCHKGSHNSGHYESFRRNHLHPPFSTPDAFRSYAQSRVASENPSEAPSPRLAGRKSPDSEPTGINISTAATSSPSLSGMSIPSPTSPPSRSPSRLNPQAAASASPHSPQLTSSSSRVSVQSDRSKSSSSKQTLSSTADHTHSAADNTSGARLSKSASNLSSSTTTGKLKSRTSVEGSNGPHSRFRRRRKANDRWWRISDEKIKECRTSDVLGMQKEVYLLFYEVEKPPPGSGAVDH